jgi:hypothetical protein
MLEHQGVLCIHIATSQLTQSDRSTATVTFPCVVYEEPLIYQLVKHGDARHKRDEYGLQPSPGSDAPCTSGISQRFAEFI